MAMENLVDGFDQEPDEQPHVDLSDLKRRSKHTYGRLVSHLGMTRYVNGSERGSRERLVRQLAGRLMWVGVVPRYGSAVGEFGRALVPLMEVAGHLEASLESRAEGEVCFQNLRLPINKLHRPHSADLTRRCASLAARTSTESQERAPFPPHSSHPTILAHTDFLAHT
ncbi:hypothetical protein CLOP_g16879 [Closterium sp. NIES-67]|nr:hypothetical protein CLOP_g16879 [Closterium sp. NIES-67]